MFKFITQKSFGVNLLAVILLIVVIIFLFFSSLGFITRHNENKKVPSVVGENVDAAKKILEAQGFETAVQDSLYIDTAAPLSVLRQSPDADEDVKINRTIYLTINRGVPPLVEMPDLRGFSFKSAELYLQSLSLKLGDTSYTPDIARNAVKEQMFNGNPISPGTKVNMGSAIDLILGSGLGEEDINVPDLVGMTVAQAQLYLSNKNISIGAILPESGVTDTSDAFITRQSPLQFSQGADGQNTPNQIKPGQLMDIWISKTPPVKDTTANSPN